MYYTQEQIDRANQADLVSFLQSQGEQLTRAGNPCTLTRYDRLMCRPHGALSLKGEPMNNETSKTSTPAAASPLTAKPDLVKNIGGTTFDIHIHFSETSRETFTDKVVRLIKNDSGDETA